jgi:hypothetical protein
MMQVLPRRFGLRTLLVASPLVAGLAAWSASEPLEEVDAWIVVDQHDLAQGKSKSDGATAISEGRAPIEPRIKSASLLADALRQGQVANLPVIRDRADPVAWLQDELVVETQPQGGLVRIRLKGRQPAQLRIIIDSVAATVAREASQASLR